MWRVGSTVDFDVWFSALDRDAREEVAVAVELLKHRGPLLSRPWADTLKGSRFANMKELRVNAKRLAIRIAFAFDTKRNALLLVAGDKRGINQALFYRRLIARADALFEDHLRKLR